MTAKHDRAWRGGALARAAQRHIAVPPFCTLALLSTLAACQGKSTVARTEVLLEVDAEAKIRDMADTLRVEISSGPKSAKVLTASKPEIFDLSVGGSAWPVSVALIAKPGHADYAFEATITAERQGDALARGRVRSSFLRDKTLVLKASLFDSCIGVFDCGPKETCRDDAGKARCVTALVEPSALEVYIKPGTSAHDAGSRGRDAGATQAGDAGHTEVSGDAGLDAGGTSGAAEGGMPDAHSGGDAGTGTMQDGGRDAATDAGKDAGGSSCTSSGPEQCWNGVDDDCNGDIDCADSACNAVAICAPSGTAVGMLVDQAAACPAGFEHGETLVYRGLHDPGCSGCGCTVSPTVCSASVYYYASTTACTADTALSGGTFVGSPTATCTNTPIGDEEMMDTPAAWRASIVPRSNSCTPGGTATAGPPIWDSSMKLCTTSMSGGGCGTGRVCVPAAAGATACAEKGTGACPANSAVATWYTGYGDSRTCGACTCSVTAGNCDNVAVQLGSDWGCSVNSDHLHDGQKNCAATSYAPPAIIVGTPTDGTCTANVDMTGALAPAGPRVLCCMQ